MTKFRASEVTSLNVTSGIKEQAGTSTQKIYTLLNLKGGGMLVNLVKEAGKNRALAQQLDDKIKTLVEPFLYNNGEGYAVPISELVLRRNKERPKHKQITQNTITKAASPNEPTKTSSELDVKANSVVTLNGSTCSNKKDKVKTRKICWKLEELGGVGEGALHMCLLIASSVHAELAKRLVKIFPNLVNDIYMCDEYYGENPLHMAIVNEDPAMVKFLLDNGADYHERCIGNFFCPEDQKASRTDKLEHEWVDLCVKTNYEGYVYWGEYPLSFAACLGQEECYRLILAKGADPDRQDTNGNTVLHCLVIHEKLNMFNMVYELGGSIDIVNRQGLTALTIAAKLARKEMFFHILKLQREIYWQLGSITCAAYPLEEIDTINTLTGEINKASALNLVVYGEKMGHLDMMDGLLVDLLYAKWNTFIKFRFYRKFAMFACYFLLTCVCFVNRPAPQRAPANATVAHNDNMSDSNANLSLNYTLEDVDKCYLINYEYDFTSQFRMVVELLCVIGAFLYLLNAAQEARFLGYQTFLENLATVPSRVLFLSSCVLMMLMIPLRFSCASEFEDVIAVFVMLSTSPYFLFFCRGFKMVGPFVVMIYKMILTDLLCFATIYLVFVMGFSQAYYVIFLSHAPQKPEDDLNYFDQPMQSILALFVMSLTEFGDIYKQFENTDHPIVAKILFIMYMALVGILLINMLIAMMGKTYQDIAERKNEWIRQWARIVLVVERGVSPKECLAQLLHYSNPMADGRKALIVRLKHNEQEKEELKVLGELKTTHQENKRRQQSGSNILSPRSTPRKTISSTSL